MGWHGSSTTTGQQIGGDESLVTAAGGAILGLAAGTHDLLSAVAAAADNFNGLGQGTTAFGGGTILASVGGDTLAAYWSVGSAPGNTAAATVDTFPGPRLLFNTDNDPNSGNNGANDLANMTPAGTQALINAIAFATPLTVADPGPDDADADGDGIDDGWEIRYGLDPNQSNGITGTDISFRENRIRSISSLVVSGQNIRFDAATNRILSLTNEFITLRQCRQITVFGSEHNEITMH